MYQKMRKQVRQLVGSLLCAALLIGLLPSQVFAAETVNASISPDISVMVDGAAWTFFSASGTQIHPILYNNTVYLPLRAVSELMSKNLYWDQATLTYNLSGTRTTAVTTGILDLNPIQQTVQIQICPEFIIALDGVACTFLDEQGNLLYPVFYNGATYLPLRAVGQLIGKTATWDEKTRAASFISVNGIFITDADSFAQTPDKTQVPSAQSGNGTYIGAEKARNIALNHAGLTAAQVHFIKSKLDYDDGRWEYEVEFYTDAYQEYDYDIDAVTGAILKFDQDVENWTAPAQNQNTNNTQIGEEKAKSIALSRAGLSSNQTRFTKVKLDYDDGRWEYELEFIGGVMEYEVTIDAYSGTVLDYEAEAIDD